MIRPRAGIRHTLVIAAGLGLALAPPAWAEPPVEYRVQAAYVSKFLLFVEWPPVETEDGDAFRVGVVGEPDFFEAMQALDGHAVQDTRVETLRVRSPGSLDGLHVLVIEPGHADERVRAYLEAAAERPILTVGRVEGFAESGGVIQFAVVEDTLRFGVNLEAAERAGLKVSSRLLRAARELPPASDAASP